MEKSSLVAFLQFYTGYSFHLCRYKQKNSTMKTKVFFTGVGLILLCAFTVKQTNHIKKTEWLIGTWENKTPRGSMYESWTKTNKTELAGKSYILKEQDTVIFETIRLVQEQDSLFYIPTVRNQNDNLPVRFALKTISDTEMVFENPKHDFPQQISYRKITSDSLVAEISGTKNGQQRKQTFSMKRIK